MLHYFRINDPYRVIGLLVVLLILYLPFLVDVPQITFSELKTLIIGEKILNGSAMYTGLVDSTAPFTAWTFAVMSWVFGDSITARHIFGFVLLFLDAVVLGLIFIDKKTFPESSFIPALIFGILCAFSFDTLSLSGDLFGLFFLLLALNSLFREIEFREENYEMVLRTGIFIGISSLFEFSFSVYVIATLIILIIYTRTSGRKILLMLLGYLLPHLLLVSIYFIKGSVGALWQYYYLANLDFAGQRFVPQSSMLIFLIVPGFFFLASLVVLNRESRFTKYQSQLIQAMFFWSLFSVLQVYYAESFRPQTFIPLMIGVSFFISHFFLAVARRRFAEISFWIFLSGIASVGLYHRFSDSAEKTYAGYFVPEIPSAERNKTIVVLADSIELYRHNEMATPFLDWSLSREVFMNPEYYDNISQVVHGFNESPEVVIDPNDLLRPFLDRIPELRRKYSRTSKGYRRID